MRPRQQTANPFSPPVNTRSASGGPGNFAAKRRARRPQRSGSGKIFVDLLFKSTKPVGRRRRFCSGAIARNRALREGKIPVYRRRQGVSLRLTRLQLRCGLTRRKEKDRDDGDCKMTGNRINGGLRTHDSGTKIQTMTIGSRPDRNENGKATGNYFADPKTGKSAATSLSRRQAVW
jgi:hypothetical protein